MMKISKLVAGILSISLILVGCGGGGGGGTAQDNGLYLGAQLDNGSQSIADFNNRTGIKHAIFGTFVSFPNVIDPASGEQAILTAFINQCIAEGAMPSLTLEPISGLNSFSSAEADAFASYLSQFDVKIFVRFGHEMNGSWFAWGQQPTLYIQKFRELADAIHSKAPQALMVWAPNQGYGYPYAGGQYSISRSSSDFGVLDTNSDGRLTQADDPYVPYFPGDGYVDWVGLSYIHIGSATTAGLNVVPPKGKFASAISGNPIVPNFYAAFSSAKNKPMIIAETGALYDPSNKLHGTASEESIKNAWIDEVYNLTDPTQPNIQETFPLLLGVIWFDQVKFEATIAGGMTVDWRIDQNSTIAAHYQAVVSNPYFVKGQ